MPALPRRSSAADALFAASFLAAAATAGAQPAATGPVEKVTVRAVANFDFDKASLRQRDQNEILSEVGKMKDVTWQTITATGHTDSVGNMAYNEKLSAKRAGAVKSYLVGKGLDPAMINTAARAAATPVAPNDSTDGRAKNRRTEIEFSGVRTAAK